MQYNDLSMKVCPNYVMVLSFFVRQTLEYGNILKGIVLYGTLFLLRLTVYSSHASHFGYKFEQVQFSSRIKMPGFSDGGGR